MDFKFKDGMIVLCLATSICYQAYAKEQSIDQYQHNLFDLKNE